MEKAAKVIFFGFAIGLWAANAPSVSTGAIGALVLAVICAIVLTMGDINQRP